MTALARTEAPENRAPATGRIDPLDGLRTVAILAVVLYHLHVPLFGAGFVGVNVFFVISGYVITALLLREREHTGRIRLGRFWGRRVLRLYPGLLALVIVCLAAWFLVSGYDGANVDAGTAAFLALTYTANFGRWLARTSMGVLSQTWSLGMEEQFYLVWPPILALLLAKRARTVMVLCTLGLLMIASSLGAYLLYSPRGGTATPDVYFSPVLNIGPLLMGCAMAIVLAMPGPRAYLGRHLGAWCTWVGAAALVGVTASIMSGWQKTPLAFAVSLPLVGVATSLLLAGLVCRRSVISRALAVRPMSWFGRSVSYSLYLWHVLVIALIEPLVPGLVGKFAALAVAIAVAIGAHYAVEKPVAALKRRFGPSRKPDRIDATEDTEDTTADTAGEHAAVHGPVETELEPAR